MEIFDDLNAFVDNVKLYLGEIAKHYGCVYYIGNQKQPWNLSLNDTLAPRVYFYCGGDDETYYIEILFDFENCNYESAYKNPVIHIEFFLPTDHRDSLSLTMKSYDLDDSIDHMVPVELDWNYRDYAIFQIESFLRYILPVEKIQDVHPLFNKPEPGKRIRGYRPPNDQGPNSSP